MVFLSSRALFSVSMLSYCAVPQSVTFRLCSESSVHKLGIFLHGENNQNPKRAPRLRQPYHADIVISTSSDANSFRDVIDSEIEHRSGDHLFQLDPPVTAKFVKLTVVRSSSLGFEACRWTTLGVPARMFPKCTSMVYLLYTASKFFKNLPPRFPASEERFAPLSFVTTAWMGNIAILESVVFPLHSSRP